jgi:hypothetical protein
VPPRVGYTPLFAGVLRGGTWRIRGGYIQRNAHPKTRPLHFLLSKTANYTPLSNGPSERGLRSRIYTFRVAPPFPCLEQGLLTHLQVGTERALVLEEAIQHVGLGTVLLCRGFDRLRSTEPLPVPCDYTLDRPCQHAGQLVPQLVGQLGVRLLTVERLSERDQPHTIPDRLAAVGYLRLVVRAVLRRKRRSGSTSRIAEAIGTRL